MVGFLVFIFELCRVTNIAIIFLSTVEVNFSKFREYILKVTTGYCIRESVCIISDCSIEPDLHPSEIPLFLLF